jgi:calcineurin-like phosphoesterase family protein
MTRLQGKKRLVLGNHDVIKNTELIKHFQKVSLWRIFKEEGFICSHIPLRKEQFRHKVVLNVHAHIHQNKIDDPAYMNVCVEHTGFAPVHMDEIIKVSSKLRSTTAQSENPDI